MIKLVILDVDGVMTDGGIILSEDQVEYKRFDVQDGMGITMIRKAGLKTRLPRSAEHTTLVKLA